MAGWRIGFVVGNAEIVERVNLQGDHSRVGMFAPLQEAAIAALDRARRTRSRSGARPTSGAATGSSAALPEPPVCEGSFYVWLRLPEGLTAERLLAEQRVAVAPGEGFGPSGAGWARLSLAVADDVLDDGIERLAPALAAALRMKIGIVVPFSWSYWGGVVEHAENQAAALRARGHEVKIVMGNDPPGRLTRLLHPRTGRHGDLPPDMIPVGRSVVVPANGSLPNIVLSPRSIAPHPRRCSREERFDVVHLHEPMTPAICVATLAFARCPIVATWHAAGDLGWMRLGMPAWGFLIDRIDARIAVSRMAAESAERWLGGGFEIVPNGVVIPEHADAERPRAPRSSSSAGTTRARACPCCCARGPRSAGAPARGCG